MRSSDVTAGNTIYASDVNKLRDDAYASSWLLAHEQTSPDLTLKVEEGKAYFGNTLVEFATGNSPSFTAPATNPRIDILSLDNTGTLIRTAGTEAGSPTAPDVPAGNIAIAQVYNRVGQTSIKDTDDSTNGYISKDLRVFIQKSQNAIKRTYTANDTWTKPVGLNYIEVELWGGGGGGAGGSDNGNEAGGGGGGGAYNFKKILASDLASTETVTVGAGGTAGSGSGAGGSGGNGGVGGTSSFGSHLSAYGGGAGGVSSSSVQAGAGGGGQLSAGSPSDLNGFNHTAGSPGFPMVGDGVQEIDGGANPDIELLHKNGTWGGGAGGDAVHTYGGNSLFGGGGGGIGNSGAGGVSVHGGNGGAGGLGLTAGSAGSVPAGGGGGGHYTSGGSGAGGAGARGEVRVIEYY